MEYDLVLVKNILIHVKNTPIGNVVRATDLKYLNIDPLILGSHVKLMEEADMIEAKIFPLKNANYRIFNIFRLKKTGYDFLDAWDNDKKRMRMIDIMEKCNTIAEFSTNLSMIFALTSGFRQ